MRITKLDENRDITSTGYIIQRRRSGWGNGKPAGAVFKPATNSRGYRATILNGRTHQFHRVLWEAFNGPIPEGLHIDHINGDKADNRLENLRCVSHSENTRAYASPVKGASSKYRGVYWHRVGKKWGAKIKHKDKYLHLGLFASEVAAALARDAKAIELGWPREGLNLFATA